MKKIASLIIGLFFVLCAMTSPWAQDTEDTVHIVKKGDTLWDISKSYLETPWKWPIVWSNNQDITNPHRIFPGDQVVISRKGGKTTITIIPASKGVPVDYSPKDASGVKDKSFVVSPHYSGYVYSPSAMTGTGTVIQKLGLGELSAQEETILIKSKSGLAKGKGITIVAKVAEIKDNEETVGYLYKAVAIARVVDAQDNVYKAKVAYSDREIRTGDIVFDDLKAVEPLKVKLHEPKLKESGRVVDLFGGVAGSSYLDFVFLNVGKNDGVEQGALLPLYKETKVEEGSVTIRDYQGMALVMQSLDGSCMALVTESKTEIKRNFVVVNDK